jgi:predicted transcriptional regulator
MVFGTMPQRPRYTPTKAELEILQVLWRRGPATVHQVRDGLGRDSGYTTVLKFLQIMTEKGLVERKVSGRAHIYSACITEKQGMGEFLGDLIGRLFGGSASRLALSALGTGKASQQELEEIRRLLKEMEGKKP